MNILVTGAGGFLGHHLVSALKNEGHHVRGVDLKTPEFSASQADEFWQLDLRSAENCARAVHSMDWVFALAADMGGMGFLSKNPATIMANNTLIDLNTLEAARAQGCRRLLFTSSACIYPEFLQERPDISGLREEDAYPAQPQDGYGWAKLYTERLSLSYSEQYGLQTRIVRLHNIFGPLGSWEGGREKAPAAMCRKVAEAVLNGQDQIEVWGDGQQTRSFCYVQDCMRGLLASMQSEYSQPLNLGQERMVTINQLAEMVIEIGGRPLQLRHIQGPMGVRGRTSDNSRTLKVLGWQPEVSLEQGLRLTYEWIHSQLVARLGLKR